MHVIILKCLVETMLLTHLCVWTYVPYIGALLQKLDRDTQKFAFKCSYALVEGHPVRSESVYVGNRTGEEG